MTTMPMEPEYPPQEPERRGDREPWEPDVAPPASPAPVPPPMTIPVEPEYPPEEDARAVPARAW